MMKTYATRAFQSSDPRFARVFEKLGYSRRDLVGETEIDRLREEYSDLYGRKPRDGWDEAKLREKISERRVEAEPEAEEVESEE